MDKNYILKSDRLGFRNWTIDDLPKMTLINLDSKVMEFFPGTQNKKQTAEFITRMSDQFLNKGFCYFAVEVLDSEKFIGFIGLSEQSFESDFTPCIDIGWRLDSSEWNLGYASEGAKRCLEYAFNDLHLESIVAMCPAANQRSERVMKKLGMRKIRSFEHPLILDNKILKDCVLYEIKK